MRRVVALVGAALVLAGDARAQNRIPRSADADLGAIVRTRGFTRGVPRNAIPSPDGRHVYFLRSGPSDSQQRLYRLDVAGGAVRPFANPGGLGDDTKISKEEQARRERQRQTERGVTGFQLSDDGKTILVPYSGDLYLADATTGALRQLTHTQEAEIDPHLSPDGRRLSFVRGDDLVVLDLASGGETVVAQGGAGIAWGVAEFVAQEEMNRNTGHWWSPDSKWLAFTRVDNTQVPRFRVPNFADPGGEGSDDPYPKAGDPNAAVGLYVLRVGDAAPRGLDLGTDVEYLARVHWAPGSDAVWVETEPRSQKSLDLRRIDLATGVAGPVWRETDPDWVNLQDDFRFLARGARFLWRSERTGHAHLEVRDASGGLVRSLTSGSWDVRGVADVDEAHGTVTFAATRGGVLEQHLYRMPLGGGKIERLSREPGWHEAAFHRQGHEICVETFSDDRVPTKLWARRRDGKRLAELPSAAQVPSASELGPAPEFLRFASTGSESLDVQLVLPPGQGAAGSIPLIVYVYAGPGAQQVRRAWPGERGLFDSWLASRGFAVARIDGRGVRPRGHDSERIFARRMGQHEVEDQVAGVRALTAQVASIDPKRVGVWGWSYGGYMTLMLLGRAADTFRTGVSVSPVVDWRGYDTHYTERYLGLPRDNSAGYDSSSVLSVAGAIRGHLALVHGASDDNVHFRESMLLAKKLQTLGTPFDLMVYPGTHMMETYEERMHLYQLVERTFAEHL